MAFQIFLLFSTYFKRNEVILFYWYLDTLSSTINKDNRGSHIDIYVELLGNYLAYIKVKVQLNMVYLTKIFSVRLDIFNLRTLNLHLSKGKIWPYNKRKKKEKFINTIQYCLFQLLINNVFQIFIFFYISYAIIDTKRSNKFIVRYFCFSVFIGLF